MLIISVKLTILLASWRLSSPLPVGLTRPTLKPYDMIAMFARIRGSCSEKSSTSTNCSKRDFFGFWTFPIWNNSIKSCFSIIFLVTRTKYLPGFMHDIPQAPSHKHFFFLLLQSSSEEHFLRHFWP